MKTEEEIRAEIASLEATIVNYREAYQKGDINQEFFRLKVKENNNIILGLLWVLGKNERFD